MDHLNEFSVEELQDALDNVEGKKPTERLLAAIAYENGVTQTELAEWYDVQRRTIYSWLKRLDVLVGRDHRGVVCISSEQVGKDTVRYANLVGVFRFPALRWAFIIGVQQLR